jgi:toxin YoeB
VEVIYLQQALEDLKYWKESGNKSIQNKISLLLKSLEETPFEGIGKPEGLKYHHSGKWSRRITKADRIIYEIEDEKIFIYSLKGHYER